VIPVSYPHFKRRVLLHAAVLILLSSLVVGQTPSTPGPIIQRDADAISLVRASLVKMGSLTAVSHDTVSIGTLTNARTGSVSPLTIKTRGTDFIRNEVGDFVFVRSGGSGKSHYSGKDHTLPNQSVAYKRAENLPVLLLLSDIESTNLQCIMVGPESVNGVLTSHIRLSVVPQDMSDVQAHDFMSEMHVWIDQQGLVVKARTFLFSPEALQNRSAVDFYYSDYRQVDQFLVPFHIMREVDRQKDSEILFASINLNATLSTADFQ
jgi:hypothetical protein